MRRGADQEAVRDLRGNCSCQEALKPIPKSPPSFPQKGLKRRGTTKAQRRAFLFLCVFVPLWFKAFKIFDNPGERYHHRTFRQICSWLQCARVSDVTGIVFYRDPMMRQQYTAQYRPLSASAPLQQSLKKLICIDIDHSLKNPPWLPHGEVRSIRPTQPR